MTGFRVEIIDRFVGQKIHFKLIIYNLKVRFLRDGNARNSVILVGRNNISAWVR